MNVEITLESSSILADYAHVPIAFVVDRVFDVENRDKSFILAERCIEYPYTKDYDAFEGEGPANWATRFDLSNWGFIVARQRNRIVGGVALAFDTPEVHMLDGRRDLVVLWDIRVAPEARGKGIGAKLFEAAQQWAIGRGCHEIKIETQNTNVAACKFYERQGCVLKSAIRNVYPALPDEICFLWHKTFPLQASHDGQ